MNSSLLAAALDVVTSHGVQLLQPRDLASLGACAPALHKGPVRGGWECMFKFLASLQLHGRRGAPLLCFSAPSPAVIERAGGPAHACKLLLHSSCEYCGQRTGYANPLTLSRLCHECGGGCRPSGAGEEVEGGAKTELASVVCTTANAKKCFGLTDEDFQDLVVVEVPPVLSTCCWPEESGGQMLLVMDALEASGERARADEDGSSMRLDELCCPHDGIAEHTANCRHLGIVTIEPGVGWAFAHMHEEHEEDSWDSAVESLQRFKAWQAKRMEHSDSDEDDEEHEIMEGCATDHNCKVLHPDEVCCCCTCGSVCGGGCCPSCFYEYHVDHRPFYERNPYG